MNTKLASLVVFALAVGLAGNAYAHKDQVIGDYKVEVGWVKEPPIAGKSNAIELIIAKAVVSDKKSAESNEDHDTKSSDKKTKHTHDEKKTTKKKSSHTHDDKSTKKKARHDHKSSGIKGLAKSLQVDVTLNDEKTTLKMVEDKKKPGRYTAEYTPKGEGHPTVHIYTKIKDKEIEATFHPEKVEAQ